MNGIFFSIIIPVYNRAEQIKTTLQSALDQNYEHYEIIVVDDGSTDQTGGIVKHIIASRPDKHIKYFYKDNGERGAARNFGTVKARGDYLNFLDSDDLLYANHLKVASQVIDSNPDVIWFHLNYDKKDTNGKIIGRGPVFGSHPNRELISGNALSCNAVFMRKTCALNNPFEENRVLAGMEDWELWLRLAAQYPLLISTTVTSSIVQHDERSVLGKNASQLTERINLMLQLSENNLQVKTFIGNDMARLRASCYSYASLHLALMKDHRQEVLNYLWKSIKTRPLFVFEKRFFAILKHLW